MALLKVSALSTSFPTLTGTVRAVDDVSFSIQPGEAVGIVGESGCGKTVTALSIMRLIPEPGRIVNGSIEFDGKDLINASPRDMERIRGNEVGMIFQDPMTSLNPVLTVERQMTEMIEHHMKVDRRRARERALEMLKLVNIPGADRRMYQYPHEFSGGMRQRVMIAMALACNPKLLIADEPTTALDVTIQAQILDLMKELREVVNSSIMLITHDLGIVAQITERVIVMYAGQIVEMGPVRSIYRTPQHPYTKALLQSVPRLDDEQRRRLMPIGGQPPDLTNPPLGCRFYPRCKRAMKICVDNAPQSYSVNDDHKVSCWLLHPLATQSGPGGEVAS